jgi:hypothetical protein
MTRGRKGTAVSSRHGWRRPEELFDDTAQGAAEADRGAAHGQAVGRGRRVHPPHGRASGGSSGTASRPDRPVRHRRRQRMDAVARPHLRPAAHSGRLLMPASGTRTAVRGSARVGRRPQARRTVGKGERRARQGPRGCLGSTRGSRSRAVRYPCIVCDRRDGGAPGARDLLSRRAEVAGRRDQLEPRATAPAVDRVVTLSSLAVDPLPTMLHRWSVESTVASCRLAGPRKRLRLRRKRTRSAPKNCS